MKKVIVTLLTAILLMTVIVGSSALYKKLSDDFQGDNLVTDKNLINSQLGEQKPLSPSSPPKDDKENGNAETNEDDGNTEAPENAESPDTTEEKEEGSSNNSQNTDTPPHSAEQDEEKNETETPENLAPDFTVLDENGNQVKLSDFRGKPVVLNFWATWCYYCKVEMPDFNNAYIKYPDIHFLMVNATDGRRDTVEIAKKFKSDNGYDFNIYFDINYEAIDAYNVRGYPTTFFISAEGELIAVGNGMLNAEALEEGIAAIIKRPEEE